ncbi:diguanylate cyclase [Acetobacteraceae bacterium KSS8]|uniref:Diguanylate cyclase n=1 Tax=Endosaccharibacter trunci TaxID=2812733 RepID=A0ABT1W9A5_9PROT|nr:diguanylate cyclase [Acetobacteraceae bacterium KSS8]
MTIATIPASGPWRGDASPSLAVLDALSGSRARWRGIAELGFDLCFEAGADGCFSTVSSGAFGWTEAELIGRNGSTLLEWPDETAFDPFRADGPVRRRRAWIKRADGGIAAVLVSTLPVRGADGRITGTMGGIQDVSEHQLRLQGMAEQLHVFRQVAAINKAMRRAVLPDMVIRIGLEQLLEAMGGYGAIILGAPGPARPGETGADHSAMAVLHRAGETPPVPDSELIAACRNAAGGGTAPWSRREQAFGRSLLLSAISTHYSEPVILAIWRDGGRPWSAADEALAAGVMNSLGGVFEHDQVQRELARQSSVDLLTGLLTRDSFIRQVERRLDRLDNEGLSATLMLVGLDRFESVNRERGFETGDEVLRCAADLLRDAVRPTDLAGRITGDLFALWLDGADQFASAERAEGLCKAGIAVDLQPPVNLRMSIGLTCRTTRSFEGVETLLEQAQAALSAIKLAGGGRWHFYNEDISA